MLAFGIMAAAALAGIPRFPCPRPARAARALGRRRRVRGGDPRQRCAHPRALGWSLMVLYVAYGARSPGTSCSAASSRRSSAPGDDAGGRPGVPAANRTARHREFPSAYWLLVPGALGLVGVATLLDGDTNGLTPWSPRRRRWWRSRSGCSSGSRWSRSKPRATSPRPDEPDGAVRVRSSPSWPEENGPPRSPPKRSPFRPDRAASLGPEAGWPLRWNSPIPADSARPARRAPRVPAMVGALLGLVVLCNRPRGARFPGRRCLALAHGRRARCQTALGWGCCPPDPGHRRRPRPEEDRVSTEALRDKIKALMPQAQRDLAQMVAFRSVHDAAQFPPAECAGMVDWLLTAFTAAACRTCAARHPGRQQAVCGHAPGPPGAPTVLLYFHHDVQPPLDDAAWTTPVVGADRARRALVRARRGRLQGRHPMHLMALRALGRRVPVTIKMVVEGSEEQGTGGLEAFVPAHPELLTRRRHPHRRRGQLRRSACRRVTATPARAWPTSWSRWTRWPARCTRACSAAPPRTRWPR